LGKTAHFREIVTRKTRQCYHLWREISRTGHGSQGGRDFQYPPLSVFLDLSAQWYSDPDKFL
jgi:hypothetical protein